MDAGQQAQATLKPLYDVDERPPLTRAIPLGLQHVLVMFASNVGLPLILARAISTSPQESAHLVQAALFVGGLATILQTIGIGPVGARLPVVMGTSLGFVLVSIPIAQTYGLPAVFGAAIVAGLIQVLIGATLKWTRRLFPPLVTGIVVTVIGFSLLPTGIRLAAGGAGAPDFGAPINLVLASVVLIVVILLNQFFRGFLSMISVLIGLVVGYLVAIPLGKVNFQTVGQAEWFSIPTPFSFGVSFPIAALIAMGFMALVTAIETIGDLEAITKGGAGREITQRELSGGIIADGVGTSLAGIFGALPNTSYSQNVGMVAFTGVMSRYVVAIGGIFLVIAGLFPKLGAVVSAMPSSVLGGAAIVMFAMVAAAGIRMLAQVRFNRRNMLIIAVSLGLGLGIANVPDSVATFPQEVRVLLETGLFQASILAIVLNLILPERDSER